MNCEHCNKEATPDDRVGFLDIWEFPARLNGGRIPSYLLVCDDCMEARHVWGVNLFPDSCDSCGAPIDPGDHCLSRERNRDGDLVSTHGLAPDEECQVLCEACCEKRK